MEKRRIGSDGPEVSLVGLGCNNFGQRMDEPSTRLVVTAALDAGITHFDTAEMYGGGHSEEFLGRSLGLQRDNVVLATKASPRPTEEVFVPGALARRIREACEGSLKRLGTDRIDLYYHHFPDAEAPLEEALEAFDSLVRAGKVLHVACSNYTAELLVCAQAMSCDRNLASFEANQVEWSLLNRDVEVDVVPTAEKLAVSTIPYFPLAAGLLTGKYRRGENFPAGSRLATASQYVGFANDENFRYITTLTSYAEARGHSILELAFAWLAAQNAVPSIIAGATSANQVRNNTTAAMAWRLSPEDLATIPPR